MAKADAQTKAKIKFEKAQLKANYAKDRSFATSFLIFLLMLIIAGLVGTMYFYWITKPGDKYFAATSDAKIFKMEPLDRPYLNERQLYQWVVEAATASYTFDFVNYRRDLSTLEVYYTQNGYRQLSNALTNSNTLKDVREKKLVTSAVATGAPIILEEGTFQGRYYWRLQTPIQVTYQSASELIIQKLVVTMVVSRVPVEEKPKGIGIEAIIVREGRIQP